MKKFSVLISVLLIFSSLPGISATAAQLGGQPLGSVDDVVAATGVDPVLKKDSLFYALYAPVTGGLEFKYARLDDSYNPTKKLIFEKELSNNIYKISGLYPAISKTRKIIMLQQFRPLSL